MTPTLMGRWQTRLAMLLTWGVGISLVFALAYNPGGRNGGSPGRLNEDFFIVLAVVAAFGLALDTWWIVLQRTRWDRDWPAVFQWGTALVEGLLVWLLLSNGNVPYIPAEESPPGLVFLAHYGLVFLASFLFVQGPMRVLFPGWRFSGGRLV